MPKITLEVPVSEATLCSVLAAAFEGGINYWVNQCEVSQPPTQATECRYMAPAYGGTVRLFSNDLDESEGPYLLTQGALLAAIGRTASEGRFQVVVCEGDLEAGEIDADIADVIIQYAVLGEIVFG